jgi:hypothetical protein
VSLKVAVSKLRAIFIFHFVTDLTSISFLSLNYTEQSPWEAISHSAIKKCTPFMDPKTFVTVFGCHWTLFWATWIQSTPSHPTSSKIHFILSYYLCPHLFPSGLLTKTLYAQACYMLHPCRPPLFDPNIWYRAQTVKLLFIRHCSPASCYFLSPWFKYFPQHPILIYRQPMFFP